MASTRRRGPRRRRSPTSRRRIRIPRSLRSTSKAMTVTVPAGSSLELDDIQSGALHERPTPYAGTYVLLRIDQRGAGQQLVRRLEPVAGSARDASEPVRGAWVTVSFTYSGLAALGVPQESLESFDPLFRQGMAARAAELGDVGESGP